MDFSWLEFDNDDDVFVRSRHRHRRRRSASVASTSTLLPDLADDDDFCEIVEEDAEPNVLFAGEVIDLTKDDSERLAQHHRPDETEMDSVTAPCGTTIKRENCIQVRDTFLGELKINFLQVKAIIRDRNKRIYIRGIPYTKLRHLNEKIRSRVNEICVVLHVLKHPGQEPEPPVLVDVEPDCVVRWRKLIVTNAQYPAHAVDARRYARPSLSLEKQTKAAERCGPVVCRWSITIQYSINARDRNKAEEELIEHLCSSDILHAEYRVPDEHNADPDAPRSLDTPIVRRPDQAYTLFDSFSGAGGVSRGAQDAGFKIRYAIDKEPEVWETYSQNFPFARLFKCDTKKYVEKKPHQPVDVLHLSPPCQVWSPAHTHAGPDDAANTETLYTCRALITKTRPRLVTLEQTFGITHAKHVQHFWSLIRDFTDLGYSVRWSIIRLCIWGSPQDRKRLILIAAAPGERLPPFPTPTHSVHGGNGTRRFNTVASALARVRPGDDLHDLGRVQSFHPCRPAWDANTLGRTVTTGGANAYHPSGQRDFTLRELAALQGFPRQHRFVGTMTRIRRQIGNAFPPNTVRVLYSHLQEWLLAEDNIGRGRPQSVEEEEDVIMIDDDSDLSGAESLVFSDARPSPAMEDVIMEDVDDEVIFVGASAGRHDDCFVDLT
ncbi:C-5 cytosine methyltransferase DmtA [Cordyceps fumosorosea ARSEF 2679]|uniref:DNA (cytosine-5-)-methyltransferase n=1 Tax=Cordyceps fumosorosea (strain ARSEF 2679) TaxID=1081104 RepID=A0A167NLB4_CORFA|nr:C-5 cytosine methyltransferase DmtA [Cordyceps fumosorosea ARSEF 2679]OAA55683.1 C-5 cytosine methyltransferase DmtA [Cordyceps fumosorosea ARSEF 2679]